MIRTVLVAVDVDDVPEDMPDDADLYEQVRVPDDEIDSAVRAALSNGLPYSSGVLAIGDVRVAVADPDSTRVLLQAASVGLEGADGWVSDLDIVHASQTVEALGGGSGE